MPKFQHLTMPTANGQEVVNGTTACGLVTALRLAAAGENMKMLDKSAFVALKETLEALRDSGSLELLNKYAFKDHSEVQKIEGGLHKKHMAEYDTIGKLLSSIDPRARSVHLDCQICRLNSLHPHWELQRLFRMV